MFKENLPFDVHVHILFHANVLTSLSASPLCLYAGPHRVCTQPYACAVPYPFLQSK